LVISLGSSCARRNGSMIVERNANFVEGHRIQKIVTIDPSLLHLNTRKSKEDIYLKSDVREAKFNERLLANAEKAKIDLEVIDRDELLSSGVDYFNDILPLKRQILSANFLQEVESDQKKGSRTSFFSLRSAPVTRSFSINPVFDPGFGKLSDRYGTQYFAIHGLINVIDRTTRPNLCCWLLFPPIIFFDLLVPRSQFIYYSVLVDIQSGEVLYREVREVKGNSGTTKLDAVVYDSFKGMKRNIR
ncbi:MAG: hypothetical protein AAF399_19565, partial [Bacteroidota bacterium]